LGAADLVTPPSGGVSASTFAAGIFGMAVIDDKLFISDQGANRVMRYSLRY
jgi:hypothetical protein